MTEETKNVEKLRESYRTRFPNTEFETPEYTFIELLMFVYVITNSEALALNYEANKEMGRFDTNF